jgi:hypothetical protein
MSTLGRSFQHLDSITAPAEKELTEPAVASIDDCMGCMRGLAVALLFNAALVLAGMAIWTIWRWLR